MTESRLEQPELRCTLWVHNDSFSNEDVLFNSLACSQLAIAPGDALAITPFRTASAIRDFQDDPQAAHTERETLHAHHAASNSLRGNGTQCFVFVAADMDPDLRLKHPTMQISVCERIAQLFDFKNRMLVALMPANKDRHCASHVEITFSDVYLARADMWRMVVSELSKKSVHAGQHLRFLGTIKATVENIYIDGNRAASAFFVDTTRPIFRSASARFVIYIQMSREMWDFDTEGTGEIMFNKVINGFLPALFSRWEYLNVNHLVSIVLFTRVEYGAFSASETVSSRAGTTQSLVRSAALRSQDYYRVVVSEMASEERATILLQLRKEFKTFLRDVSTTPRSYNNAGINHGAWSVDDAEPIITGKPSSSMRGNVLEAISLASSQFSTDYIDRDLVRTGLSIVVISPGSGVFEVDDGMLKLTTENLVNNGVGIDLVCLSNMPLHSVPLFKYRLPAAEVEPPKSALETLRNTKRTDTSPAELNSGHSFSVSPIHSVSPEWKRSWLGSPTYASSSSSSEWGYAIPHWVDISYWTSPIYDAGTTEGIRIRGAAYRGRHGQRRRRNFVPRCRMYELQMMGLMENEMSNISIPYLQSTRSCDKDGQARLAEHQKFLEEGSFELNSSSLFVKGMADLSLGRNNTLTGGSLSDMKQVRDEYRLMESYDDGVFTVASPEVEAKEPALARKARDTAPEIGLAHNSTTQDNISLRSHEAQDPRPRYTSRRSTDEKITRSNPSLRSQIPKEISRLNQPTMTSSKSSGRENPGGSLRMALQGKFGKSTAVIASTKESAEPSRSVYHDMEIKKAQTKLAVNPVSEQVRASLSRTTSVATIHDIRPSRPIAIPKSPITGPLRVHDDLEEPSGSITSRKFRVADNFGSIRRSPPLRQPRSRINLTRDTSDLQQTPRPAAANVSPWLTLLNPSNPKANNVDPASQLQRWQHVFPRPPRASNIKWKSLCAPAALPLTSEYFPTAEQLRTEWQESPYKINVADDDDDELAEVPRGRMTLIKELIGFRLSHGFQIVVGQAVAQITDRSTFDTQKLLDPNFMAEDGDTIFMSKGNAIHCLICLPGSEVQVIRYQRKTALYRLPSNAPLSSGYSPLIRTALSDAYERRHVSLAIVRDDYNWNYIDNFLSGYQDQFSDTLRFWRARFVLIPVQPTISTTRRHHTSASEDNDEEIRIEGIGKLTQMFQRHRYVPPDERDFQAGSRRRRDSNPLAVEYYTQEISAIINAGADNYRMQEQEAGQTGSTGTFRTSNIDLGRLALEMQGRQGVGIADRRWHWKMHRDCFLGSDMTSWLIDNFRDLESRSQAVEFGNVLMHRGLFKHVDNRHDFRDGNYFFDFIGEYRASKSERPESRSSSGWFGSRKSEKSTPSTPLMEPVRHFGTPERATRARSNTADSSVDSGGKASNQTSRRMARTRLSGLMRYDVDHRKKSYRREVINLHFTEKHNVEGCYHIRIEWMNVTAKLIEDSIVYWATTVEKYGLRLVEVPIAEASTITDTHPFRKPYIVELALQPPQAKAHFHLEGGFFAPAATMETHFYTKALLRRLGFVLDMESASNFRGDVEVTYSWGKPDYKLTQYIHRSGSLLAQIMDDNRILLLANRLCNYRAAEKREGKEMRETGMNATASSVGHESLLRSPSLTRHMNMSYERSTPTSSSMANDTPVYGQLSGEGFTPEQLGSKVVAFCRDKDALAAVYEEAGRTQAPTSARSTPLLSATIPKLGLPPSMEMDEPLE